MSMDNPFKPPQEELRYSPFGKRLRRACAMAWTEYRAGLARDRFTTFELVRAWLGLIVTFLLAILVLVIVVIVVLVHVGILG